MLISEDPARGAEVLAEAVARIASYWRLSGDEVASIVGGTLAEVRRSRPDEEPFTRAQLLLLVFIELNVLVGGNDRVARTWLNSPATDLDGVPLELMGSRDGLERVAGYIAARRRHARG